MRFTFVLLCATAALCWNHSATTWSQETDDRPQASIQNLAWISGHWNGSAMGGTFEETWNPPVAGSMMGMFKFIDSGNIKFYELLTIVPQGNSLLLRLKHFDHELVGWEEKAKSIEFPLSSISETEAKFDGLTFKKINDQQMVITVVTQQKDGSTQELRFECNRVDTTNSNPQHAAIEQVFALDSVLSKQRDRLPEKLSLAAAVQAYVFGLDNIDFSHCPEAFRQAFKNHRDAWNNSISFFNKHDQLRGEMQAVIADIRKMDSAVVSELDRCMRPVFETWKQVESSAQAFSK